MNKPLVFSTLGKLMLIVCALMLPPLAVSLIYADGQWLSFLLSMLVFAAVGLPLTLLLRSEDTAIYTREGMAIAGLGWLAISLMVSLPLIFGGTCGFADAFFEIASGFTTTGATVLTNVEELPESINFLRCYTHWIGGMGVLVLTTAVLPGISGSGTRLAKAESSGPQYSKLLPKVADNSKLLYMIYGFLTLLLVIILKICGMSVFDSILHAMSTAGTGGFSNKGASIGYYNSLAVELVCGGFMILFGISFTFYFRLLAGDIKGALKNHELLVYIIVCIIATLAITFDLSYNGNGFLNSLRQSFFQVSSLISTTGFGTADFDKWPVLSKMILLVLMLLGSCAGSTAGGLKLIRVILLVRLAGREISKSFMPRKVKVIKLDGKSVPEEMLSQIAVYFFVYALIALVGMFTLAACGCDIAESVSGSIACISNIGPGFGRLGPAGSFGFLPPIGKVIMSLIMLAGRLEFYPLLILALPSAWRKS